MPMMGGEDEDNLGFTSRDISVDDDESEGNPCRESLPWDTSSIRPLDLFMENPVHPDVWGEEVYK